MKKTWLLLLLPFLLSGCDKKISITVEQETNPDVNTDDHPDINPTITNCIIDFTSLSSETIPDFDSENASSYKEKMKSIFNKEETILSDVTISGYTQYLTVDVKPSEQLRALFVCSAKKDGSLTLTFNKKITTFTITAQAYHKFIWNTWSNPGNPFYQVSMDNEPMVMINNETLQLPTDGLSEGISSQEVVKTYNLDSYNVTLSGKAGQRAFIKKISITLEDE